MNQPLSHPVLPLTKAEKAAVIVHLLVQGGVDPGVGELPPNLQRTLARSIAKLRFVDQATLMATAAEFTEVLDAAGLRFPDGLAKTLGALDGTLSPSVIQDLTAELPPDVVPDVGASVWEGLLAMPPEVLQDMLRTESPTICAIVLSKLPAERAAGLVADLPPERMGDIAVAFSATDAIPPATVARVGLSLGRAASSTPSKAFQKTPVDRLGAILNASGFGERTAMLQTLDDQSPDFASAVRAAVFSWENIPDRLDARDVPRVVRAVAAEDLLAALSSEQDVEGTVVHFLLANLSGRLADQTRAELEDAGEIAPERGEAGKKAVAVAIRQMEDDGELALITPD
ncbi:FliG C-terminal domain-containing protein [Jannaschia sp. LMIT008]|uniref:FliG C-terminal domain-containing protein n=1 Tax=Jannaschia maritima TaxID=3032585 RepID=UPI002810E044|nr:FliG C-terminal domain-containing protein [Jannaschia sp. LMIT008]